MPLLEYYGSHKGYTRESWTIKNLVENILEYFGFFTKFYFSFILKKLNELVHFPAKYSFNSGKKVLNGFDPLPTS